MSERYKQPSALYKKISPLSLALTRLRQGIEGSTLGLTADEVKALWAPIAKAFGELAAEVPGASASGADADSVRFGDFLSMAGNSLVAAQDELDEQSKRYLQRNQGREHIHPSVFRIPKLKAEIKFALEKESERGFNLLFYKGKDQETTRHQQGMSFEVISVPPSPETLNTLRTERPQVDFILAPSARRALLERAAKATLTPASQPNADDREILEDAARRPRVLIWEKGAAEDGESAHYLLYADRPGSLKKAKAGLWLLTRKTADTQDRLTVVFRYTKTVQDRIPGERPELIYDEFLRLCDLQEKLLRGFDLDHG